MYWHKKGIHHLLTAPVPGSRDDTEAWREFRAYDKKNPHIWDKFLDVTMRAKKKGFKHFSGMQIMGIMRWETPISDDNEVYKVDHNQFPYFTRKLMLLYPEFEGFFILKPLLRG